MDILTLGGMFVLGIGTGISITLLFARQYFRKAETLGKVPKW